MYLGSKALLLILASLATAQFGPSDNYNPGSNNNPYGGGEDDNDFGRGGFDFTSFLSSRQKILIAHGVLASLAFVIFFPLGSILIRLGSFRGLWLVHGLFQIFAYLVYICAFGIGIWMTNNMPISLIGHYHPVIGILCFCLLFFQPILGLIHHRQFKNTNRRTIWSHGHIWLGRIVITLGIINGGLGMLLAQETGFFAPTKGQIVVYAVVAAIVWLAWVGAAVVGERRKGRAREDAEVGSLKYEQDKERFAYYGGHE